MAQKQINEHLIFDDMSRELSSLILKNKKVTLGQAAAFCLDCLIAAQGQVVSQETLIEEGWRKHGFEVSTGNVRQVISQLRRAFSQLKESPDLLITVHKLGYRLQVASLSATEEDEQVASTELEYVEPILVEAPAIVSEPSPQPKVYKANYWVWAGILLLNAVFAASYFFMNRGSSLPQVQYQVFSAPLVKGKQFFVDQRILDKREFIDHSLTLLTNSPFWEKDNANYRWFYLNAAANLKVHSFFLCDRPITEKNLQCTSRVFVEE